MVFGYVESKSGIIFTARGNLSHSYHVMRELHIKSESKINGSKIQVRNPIESNLVGYDSKWKKLGFYPAFGNIQILPS